MIEFADTLKTLAEKYEKNSFLNGDPSWFMHQVEGDVNKEDMDKIWKDIFAELEKKFDEKTMDIWYSFNELNGHKKMKNKELGQKYNMIPSRVTYYLYIVNSYILKNPKLREMFMDLRELVAESRDIKDRHRHVLDA